MLTMFDCDLKFDGGIPSEIPPSKWALGGEEVYDILQFSSLVEALI